MDLVAYQCWYGYDKKKKMFDYVKRVLEICKANVCVI